MPGFPIFDKSRGKSATSIRKSMKFVSQCLCLGHDTAWIGFWRTDHRWQDVGLERRVWTLAQAPLAEGGRRVPFVHTDLPHLSTVEMSSRRPRDDVATAPI